MHDQDEIASLKNEYPALKAVDFTTSHIEVNVNCGQSPCRFQLKVFTFRG